MKHNTNNQREDVKPLYKSLNELRTPGIWDKQGPKTNEYLEQIYYTIHSKNSYDITGFLYPYSDKDGNINHHNIDYINLCVNNLHLLAEALEAVIRVADRKTDEFDKAKEALKRIS